MHQTSFLFKKALVSWESFECDWVFCFFGNWSNFKIINQLKMWAAFPFVTISSAQIRLSEVSGVEVADRRGYLTLELETGKEGVLLLRYSVNYSLLHWSTWDHNLLDTNFYFCQKVKDCHQPSVLKLLDKWSFTSFFLGAPRTLLDLIKPGDFCKNSLTFINTAAPFVNNWRGSKPVF